VRSKVGDPELAEDILQDSLLKAIRAAPDLRDEDRMLAWFYSILRNSIADAYRRQSREPLTVDVEIGESFPDDPDDIASVCECFRAILPTLRPEYAGLIEELDLKEGAPTAVMDALGITANNLKVRHHRARQALRRRLEETCRVCAEHHCIDCTCERG
jgi:RNA polymerase sigma-70 factor (ECF subfamily)